MSNAIWRVLVVTHRYLGVAVGLLMLVWFVSGIVMMYTQGPSVTPVQRAAVLGPINWAACCNYAATNAGNDAGVQRAEIENLAGTPVLRMRFLPRQAVMADLTKGTEVQVEMPAVRRIAEQAAPKVVGPGYKIVAAEQIEGDQWTLIGGGRGGEYFRFAFDDPAATRLYVAGDGEIALWSTRSSRFWGWLGVIPHWLYFQQLRTNPRLWTQIVIWTSILGTFLTVIGLYLGITRFGRTKSGRLSPYSGWFYWHHLIGLAFGVVTLTWVVSGLISLNPFGFLEGGGGGARTGRVQNGIPNWELVQHSLETLRTKAIPNVVNLSISPFLERLYWIGVKTDGSTVRLDEDGNPVSVSAPELANVVKQVTLGAAIKSQDFLPTGDAYYFDFLGREHRPFPVLRVVMNDAQSTRYYFDIKTGALVGRIDANGRGYRWLFGALHRWDFLPVLRARPVWDIVTLFFMLGGLASVATGVYLALRRIAIDVTPRKSKKPV